MQDVNVVVVFYSRFGSTERLALAAAVGAVQGRANIRLRRVPDLAEEASEVWKEHRDRMNNEYVAPRDADAEWADAILLGMPSGSEAISTEFAGYIKSLNKLAGKIGASFMCADWTTAANAAMSRAGLLTLPAPSDPDALTAARMQGRSVAEAVRSRRDISRRTEV